MHLISGQGGPDFQQAVYDNANCFLVNKEYRRCIEMLEKFEMQSLNLKFRNLAGRALLLDSKTQQCIRLMAAEASPTELDPIKLDGMTLPHLQASRHLILA